MKKLFNIFLIILISIVSITSLTGCNIIDYIALQEQNSILEKNLAFERKFPNGIIDENAELNYISRSVPEGEEGNAIQVVNGAQVIINNGSFDGGQTPFGGAGNTAIWCKHVDAKVTINGGTFTIGGLAEGDTGHIDLIYCSAGTIEIKGGTFKGADDTVWLLNCKDASYKDGTAKIIVTGGTFINFNPSNCISEGEATNFVAEDYVVISEIVDEDTIYTVIPKIEEPDNTDKEF